jgi:hypothetical protein
MNQIETDINQCHICEWHFDFKNNHPICVIGM